eukprot:3491823-Amphidinium_carterae.1
MSARVVAAEQAASAADSWTQWALGRPREFKSVREDWKDWSFQFKAFLCGANPDAGAALDAAGIQDQPVPMMQVGVPVCMRGFSRHQGCVPNRRLEPLRGRARAHVLSPLE